MIVGGGVAGLEALLALKSLAGDRVALTLVAPQPDFLYKPLLVEEPFDLARRSATSSGLSRRRRERGSCDAAVGEADHVALDIDHEIGIDVDIRAEVG